MEKNWGGEEKERVDNDKRFLNVLSNNKTWAET